MRFSLPVAASLAVVASAVPTSRTITPSPTVNILNTTFIGNVSGGIESFYGIPYAQPPVGPLRMKRPQPLSAYASPTVRATATPIACPQLGSTSANIVQGEDCLTVNVQRPSDLNSTASVPVFFWIFGGGFERGYTARYDGSGLVEKSMELGHPIIFVSVNYRTNIFGFLGGREVQADGVSNLGLRDQRLAMEWVQDNIAAFGGDPTQVTIMGESAGSISTLSHTIIEGGNNNYSGRPLFRGAIMDSGTLYPTDDITSPQAQDLYDQVVLEAGCGSSSNTLDCLRNTSYAELSTIIQNMPTFLDYSGIALAFPPRQDPNDSFYPVSVEVALQAGNYTRVPIITGDQQDEGTIFTTAMTNTTTPSLLTDYLQVLWPNSSQSIRQGLVDGYSTDPADGAPFGTGSLNQLYPQYKMNAALIGDAAFTLQRRNYLSTVSTTVPSWSYLDSHRYGDNPSGTYHSSDTEEIFNTAQLEVNTAARGIATDTFRSYYISFTHYLNPNAINATSPLIYWPRYTTWDPVLLNLRADGNTLIQDDFRAASAEYLAEHVSELHF
ncbi:hypothetical protein BP6252_01548 [Coleophoma cylindrospora]|uniref:Carboxylic ester hydrolase n=1 Tax=Coleophoma cylindrospora TaxID=1849047 RepID=A0A3D8ST89_9HELO|nr:hypothetical protein BP6252_01548 [Coleophoma cylindrospora]